MRHVIKKRIADLLHRQSARRYEIFRVAAVTYSLDHRRRNVSGQLLECRSILDDLKEKSVSGDENTRADFHEGGVRGFFSSLLLRLVRDAVKFITASAVGTGAGAIVCWYYGIPLVFSVLGGILVLGLAQALATDSLFSRRRAVATAL